MNRLATMVCVFLSFINLQCARQNIASSACYKGRLEVKGICSNYTVKLLEGNMDTAKIEAKWKDEVTGKVYAGAFGISNPCAFPAALNAGDEFYFTLGDAKNECAVCLAYYPTPPRKLSIKVLDKPCR